MKKIVLLFVLAVPICAWSGEKTAEDLGVVLAADGPVGAAPKPHPLSVPKEPEKTSACPGQGVLFLPTGFIFYAMLPEAIYSYNTGAPVSALVENDVKFKDQVTLPKGTHLIGTASTLHTLDRVNITFNLAVLPDGCEFQFAGLALSADDGSAGIKGKVEKHEDSVAAQVVLQSFLSAANVAASAASTVAPVEGAVASGVTSEASNNVSQNLNKTKSLESIDIKERTGIRVFVLRRFVLNGEDR